MPCRGVRSQAWILQTPHHTPLHRRHARGSSCWPGSRCYVQQTATAPSRVSLYMRAGTCVHTQSLCVPQMKMKLTMFAVPWILSYCCCCCGGYDCSGAGGGRNVRCVCTSWLSAQQVHHQVTSRERYMTHELHAVRAVEVLCCDVAHEHPQVRAQLLPAEQLRWESRD